MRWVFILIGVLGWAIAGFLAMDNARLRSEPEAASTMASPLADASPAATEQPENASKTRRPSLLERLGSSESRDRPSLPEAVEETRAERRRRRSEKLRAMLGREPGESDEDYLARARPLVVTGLAQPRVRTANAREEAERAAKVTDEQREKLDAVLDDTYAEALDLANDAIASGDLSPYRRNWAGALSAAGGFGAVLSTADQRLGEVLTPEQQQIIYDQGFEWGEYIGAQAPWENLNPPPEEGGESRD